MSPSDQIMLALGKRICEDACQDGTKQVLDGLKSIGCKHSMALACLAVTLAEISLSCHLANATIGDHASELRMIKEFERQIADLVTKARASIKKDGPIHSQSQDDIHDKDIEQALADAKSFALKHSKLN